MAEKPKKRYFQIFIEAYKKEFPCLLESQKGIKFAFCTVCRCDINISHGGKTDIKLHINSKKHKELLKCAANNSKIGSFFVANDDRSVIRAECYFTSFLMEHNIPLAAADHAGHLFRKMFPKSEEAKRYSCGRTKTAAIIGEMALHEKSSIVFALKNGPFSIATDGTNDSDSKLYPIVVTFFNTQSLKVVSCLLSLPALKGDSTGRNIGNMLLNVLKSFNIPILNCLALSSDNAPVMIGQKNGVAAVLKEHNKNLIVMGCPCHLIHLAAEKGAACLPIKVEDVLIDIYYYLEKSAKRKDKLRQLQNLYDTEVRKILKHVCTRWLSLGKCLGRLLEQWQPLVSFYKDEVKSKDKCLSSSLYTYKIPKIKSKNESSGSKSNNNMNSPINNSGLGPSVSQNTKKRPTDFDLPPQKKINSIPASQSHSTIITREERIFMFLTTEVNKAFCYFLLNVIPIFDKTNTILQSQVPHIHLLRQLLFDMLTNLFIKFVKPLAVKNCSSPFEVKYNLPINQKNDDDIIIGNNASNIVASLKPEDKNLFFSSIRNFFCVSCDYIVHKFPLTSDVLKHAAVTNISTIAEATFNSVQYFVDKYPVLLHNSDSGENSSDCKDLLQTQFCELQMACIPPSILEEERIDVQWSLISKIKGADGLLKYDRLSKVMLGILTIPHSNAECERMFSQVKKTRTEFRASLSDKSLEDLILTKCRQGKCFDQEFGNDFLKKAKSATTILLTNHTSKE